MASPTVRFVSPQCSPRAQKNAMDVGTMRWPGQLSLTLPSYSVPALQAACLIRYTYISGGKSSTALSKALALLSDFPLLVTKRPRQVVKTSLLAVASLMPAFTLSRPPRYSFCSQFHRLVPWVVLRRLKLSQAGRFLPAYTVFHPIAAATDFRSPALRFAGHSFGRMAERECNSPVA